MALQPNVYDEVTDQLHDIHQKVVLRLQQRFRRTRSYRADPPLSPDEELYWYNQLTPENMRTFVEKYGEDKVNKLIMRNELRRRKER